MCGADTFVLGDCVKGAPSTSSIFTGKETEAPHVGLVQGDSASTWQRAGEALGQWPFHYTVLSSQSCKISPTSPFRFADSMNIKTSYSNSLCTLKSQNLQLRRFLKSTVRWLPRIKLLIQWALHMGTWLPTPQALGGWNSVRGDLERVLTVSEQGKKDTELFLSFLAVAFLKNTTPPFT